MLVPAKEPEEFSKDAGSTGKLMSPMLDDPERQVLGSELRKADMPDDAQACQLRASIQDVRVQLLSSRKQALGFLLLS